LATYAVGDVQGCLDPLHRVLEAVRFDPAVDRLWLVGDLVNRGPDSLGTLRFVRDLGPAAIAVLGNHDLHLLAVALTERAPRRKDTFDPILAAADRDELLDWLRHRPLVHHDPDLDAVMVHAGISFQFSLADALACAREVEAVLAGPEPTAFLDHMYGNEPAVFGPALTGVQRLRAIVNIFTRMRFINHGGRLDFDAKEGVAEAPSGYFPWFERLHDDFAGRRIIFGHWAALEGRGTPANCLALDTGCCWGRCLTLLRLEDGKRFSTDCG